MSDLAADDLTRPLGRSEPSERRRFVVSARTAFGALAGVLAIVAAAQLWFARGDGRVAVAEIARAAPPAAPVAPPAAPEKKEPAPAEAAERPVMNAQEMETASGVTVIRGGGAGAPQSMVIRIDQQGASAIAAPDRMLLEKSRYGALPRIGPDGTRPAQAYARPFAGDGKPRIAILVGGLGVSQQATSDALSKLPGPISVAFAPYGGDLDRLVQRARDTGHELFLQAPMEPFDYPDNDPGPHTLRVGVSDADNLDKLHWVMSRIQGYVGVVNFMGAKFTAQETALRPVVKDVADRGLLLFDDGSSNRSRLVASADALKGQAARADAVIDSTLRAEAIDRELAKLEQTARDRGYAIGAASALPVTIDRLARWAKTLEAKGIVLAPVTGVVAARKTAS
ncbi:MAG: hypothetical protein BGP06_01305 [Rhizobiales bacterium 65-9]|nr:divergent polysaccharide deacetylase family protein [Hyphomicrobiales bacterium]OJY37375.1 MAG: hypothetical protein BGP06_01305 [Rhizobiales bacterium 65-9]